MKDDAESHQHDSVSEDSDNEDQCMDDASFCGATGYPESKLYALVLTPTRELAMQVHKHLTTVAAYIDIKVSYIRLPTCEVQEMYCTQACFTYQ